MKRERAERSDQERRSNHVGLYGFLYAELSRCLRLPVRVALRLHESGVTSYLLALLLLSQSLLVVPPAYASARAASVPEPRLVMKLAASPTQTTETVNVFGPRRFDRTGPLTRESAQFTLPPDVVAPFTLQVQNGAPDGSGRVLMGSVKLNGAVVFGAGELGPQTPTLSLTVTPAAANILEVSFFGRKDSFLIVTVTGKRVINGTPPSLTDFSPKKGEEGAAVTLNGTSLKVDAGETTVTFAGAGGTRRAALVSSSTPTEVRVTVPNGAVTGLVELTTPFGHVSTASPFTVEAKQDFNLTVAPSAASAIQRGTATQIISVTSPQSDFTQLVRLSASGLPAGVRAQFEPSQITAGASSTLTLILSDVDLAPGSYAFNVGGKSDLNGRELSHDAQATLNVAAAGQTTLTGQVLSIDKEPILGATVSLDGKTSTTDAAGIFFLSGITAGTARPLMINGTTASAPNRNYPVITEPANVVAGQANVVPFTFYLPPIDTQFDTEVVPGQNTVVNNPRVEGLAMTVPAGANLRNRDGSPVSRVSITPLDPDRTPAPLPSNVATPVVYTSQPGGAQTDVPTPVVYPNLAGANPGTRVELYAFNHDTVKWYVYGFGRVSVDGRSIVPEVNPATGKPYGLLDFSWHFPNVSPSGNPGDNGGCDGGRTAHPVDLSTGLKIENSTDISFGGARGRLELSRVYTTDLPQSCDSCPFGRGTTHNYAVRLSGSFTQGGAGRVIMPEQVTGRLFSYAGTETGGALLFTPSGVVSQSGDVLRKFADGTFEYRRSHGGSMRFNSAGRLTSLSDRNGNTTTLGYTGSNLTSINDAVGRSITLAYDGSGRITSATDPLGRVTRYTYEGTPGVAGSPGLTTVKDPLGNVTRYSYVTGGRLASITSPLGNVVKRVTYDGNGRVASQQFADGGIERYSYELAGSIVSTATVTDPLGRTQTKRFNANGYVIESTDALGQHSKIERDMTTNLPLATVGPCGCPEVTRQFDERGNVTSVTDRLGTRRRSSTSPPSTTSRRSQTRSTASRLYPTTRAGTSSH
jgi:YD repeat-containing protein